MVTGAKLVVAGFGVPRPLVADEEAEVLQAASTTEKTATPIAASLTFHLDTFLMELRSLLD
jgi:hypothetical protein